MSLSSATSPAHAAELAQGGGAAPSASLTTVTAPTRHFCMCDLGLSQVVYSPGS